MTNTDSFYGGRFSKGSNTNWEVVEHDYSGEYGLTEYIAAATQGEEVAVGYLYFHVSLTDEEFARDYPGQSREGVDPFYAYSVPAIIIPGLGVWLAEPVWRSLAEAESALDDCFEALLGYLDRQEGEVPLYRAHMATFIGERDLDGGDITKYYGPRTYACLEEELANRLVTKFTQEEVNAFIDELLEEADFGDQKGEFSVFADEPQMPEWLAHVLGRDQSLRGSGGPQRTGP